MTCRIVENFSTSGDSMLKTFQQMILAPMIEHTFEPIKAQPQPSVKFAQENPNFLKPRKAPKVFRLSTLRGWVLFFQIFFRGPELHFMVIVTLILSSSNLCVSLTCGMGFVSPLTLSELSVMSQTAYFFHAALSI